ncbi:hypothetical protein [Marinomonas mediterranea]|uniref:hypothetical protein n=1 Tax=Marinomonas mediterranea TaxID=119864 RepID=UPI00234AE0BC|nr:hypothetical protein [Marinomonas mediterranea]WCN07449.1 hypothetical protein GV055_00215 [Marinomonas mediterranea]
MRIWTILCLTCVGLASTQTYANNDAFERLKNRYQAIESGEETLPDLKQKVEETQDTVSIPVGEELIFELQLGKYLLGDVIAIKSPAGAMMSLSDVSNVLDFPITVNDDVLFNTDDAETENTLQVLATGWVRTPDNHFELTQRENEFTVKIGETLRTIPHEEVQINDDIYIESTQLARLFSIEFNINYQKLNATISSKIPIPLEERLARQARLEGLNSYQNRSIFPLQAFEYSSVTQPLLDLRLGASAAHNQDSKYSLSMQGANDLAYFSTNYFLAIDQNKEITTSRFNASRQDKSASLLGPLSATEIQVGDLSTTDISPLESTQSGVGIRVNNSPLYHSQSDNTINLEGDIQPNWDIEVYRNKLLVASQLSSSDGHYTFSNVPLEFGDNQIELIFYGPQGQIKREEKFYYVSAAGQGAGSLNYDITIAEENQRLFEHYSSQNSGESALAINALVKLSVTDWWNIQAGTKHYQETTEQANQNAYNSTFALFGKALLTLDYLEDDNGAYKQKTQLSSKIANQAVNLIHSTEKTLTDESVESKTTTQEASISGAFSNLNLSYSQRISRIKSNASEDYVLQNRIGTRLFNVPITNQISWGFGDNDYATGSLQARDFYDIYTIKGGIDYNIDPSMRVNTVNAAISRAFGEDIQAQIAYKRNISTKNNESSLDVKWKPNEFSISSNLSYSDLTKWSARLIAQFSFGVADKAAFTTSKSLTRAGSVAARVFHDQNHNGIYDLNEPLLKGVTVESKQSVRKAKTNEQGIAVLAALPVFQKTDIDVDTTTLPNPYMIRSGAGVSVSPRKGTLQSVDLPIVIAREVEGFVKEYRKDGSEGMLAYVPLEVVNKQGVVIKTAISEFDGYYAIAELPPQAFTVRVAQAFIDTNQYLLTKGSSVEVSQEMGTEFIEGVDLVLRKAYQRNGYSAHLGQFNSVLSLRSYWTLLRNAHPQLADYSYFYLNNNGVFDLYVGFSKTKQNAEAACSILRNRTRNDNSSGNENSPSCTVRDIVRQ